MGKLGRAWVGAWVVHGCMVVGGFLNGVLYYLGIGEVGSEHWGSPGLGLVVMSLVVYCYMKL